MQKEEVLKKFLAAWNMQDTAACEKFLAADVELRSTYALNLFPESGGTIRGKSLLLNYMQLLFDGMTHIDVTDVEILSREDYFVVKANNENKTLNYYNHYYINDDNLIYLVKANMTQPMP